MALLERLDGDRLRLAPDPPPQDLFDVRGVPAMEADMWIAPCGAFLPFHSQ
jgi:hypothetical protein